MLFYMILQKKHSITNVGTKRKTKAKLKKFIVISGFFVIISLISFVGILTTVSLRKKTIITPLVSEALSTLSKKTEDTSLEKLAEKLKKANIAFSDIAYATDSGVIVSLKTDNMLRFSKEKSYDKQISSLQLILGSLTIEGRQFLSLDFRFEKPLIVFK